MTGLEFAKSRGIPPTLMVECAGDCIKQIAVGEGLPWPVMLKGAPHPYHAIFCGPECVLKLLQPINCYGGVQ